MLQRKIWLAFLFVLAIGIAVSARIVYLGDSVQSVSHLFLAEKLPLSQRIGELRLIVADEERLLYEYYSYTATREAFLTQRSQNMGRLENLIKKIEVGAVSSTEIAELRARLAGLGQLSDKLSSTLANAQIDWDAARTLLAQIKPQVRKVEITLANITEANQQAVSNLGEQSHRSVLTMMRSVIGFSVLIFGVALFVGYYVVTIIREGAERRRLALFAERDPNPVLRLNAVGEVLYANPATTELLGHLNLATAQLQQLLPSDLQQHLTATRNTPSSNTQFEVALGSHTLEFTVAHLTDFSEFHVYIKDISARKQAETKLRTHHDELEKLVEIRTKDLEIARDEALQASQTKSAFIANVSHEVRTPLTPIIGFAETMLHDDQDPEIRKGLLTSILHNARHLLNIINEILDLSKIEANRLEVEIISVDTMQVVYDINAIADLLAREKGLQFSIKLVSPVPLKIHSDPTRIKQILLNLLTNALKFTDKGQVDLLLGFNPLANQMEFTVSDTGIGIPQDKLDRLFKAFSQADSSTTRRFGGTGLGLYISLRLAKLLGGDISVKSIDQEGTQFKISIAAGEVDQQSMTSEIVWPQIGISSTHTAKLDLKLSGQVLVAEDSPDIQKLISYYILNTGAELTVVGNGQLAMEAALSNDYDLILMDMQMPVMGGMEAIEILRATGCSSPIYALTANAMREDREAYQRIGCNGFLSKPIELEQFFDVLATHLRPADAHAHTTHVQKSENLLRLITGFVESLPDYIDRLLHAMDSAEHDEITALAHQLSGMGGSFGFPEISQKAKILETAAKNGEYNALTNLVQQLCELLTKISEQNVSAVSSS